MLSNFVWKGNLFSAWARQENLFSCGMGLGNFIIHGKPHAHSPLRHITRNSNVIESSTFVV